LFAGIKTLLCQADRASSKIGNLQEIGLAIALAHVLYTCSRIVKPKLHQIDISKSHRKIDADWLRNPERQRLKKSWKTKNPKSPKKGKVER
jgi:hypothetical protein